MTFTDNRTIAPNGARLSAGCWQKQLGVKMANIDITKAKAVRGASDEQNANKLIALGWVLIDTASGKDESGYPFTRYSLAWLSENEIPKAF
jgi:hypothetical protein